MSAQNSTDPQDEVNSLLADVLKFKEVRNRRPLSCLPCRQRKYVHALSKGRTTPRKLTTEDSSVIESCLVETAPRGSKLIPVSTLLHLSNLALRTVML